MMRTEHPRPDFARKNWTNLNGEWEFAEDYSKSGKERGLWEKNAPDGAFPLKINVPFCRESRLSGIGHVDFCDAVWYRKTVVIPEKRAYPDGRVFLHVGAADWRTTLWVNGERIASHTGGYVSFSFDVTRFLVPGENVFTILCEDELRSHAQAAGKQSDRYASHGCSYTRTTGIWQTVWLEETPRDYIKSFRIFPNVSSCRCGIEISASAPDGTPVSAAAEYDGREVGRASGNISVGALLLDLPLAEKHLWEIGKGRLYSLKLTLGDDEADTYFGLRSVECRNGFIYINGKRIFQRLVLDQGFYPDGIYTAPSDADLVADIERSVACGFDGARLHQKIFEPRFLYHCDRLGYIVWGEHANWVMDASAPRCWAGFIPEWVECLCRDFNHPAIIGWCPLNETQRNIDEDFVRSLAAVTRSVDPTRPFIDGSGWTHFKGLSDIDDNHDYEQDPAVFRARYEDQYKEGVPVDTRRNPYPVFSTFVSEYGGIRWSADGSSFGWGYGNAPKTEEEFIERFRGLTDALLDNPGIGGLCYTQLTDVEQEINGLYTYGRKPKFPPEIFRSILQRKAAAEEERE